MELLYMVKEELVNKWFEKAKNDIEEADFLLDNNRSLDTVAFHIQQSAEKYLKGFLIYHGWKLEKIHDLIKLLGGVEKINKSFKIFNKPLQKIKNFYIESRYPIGYDVWWLT